MSYIVTIRCKTFELNSYAYKYSDSKELTKILRRVQATGIDDFLQFKAFKVGCLKYAPKPNSEYHPISINIRDDKGNVVYISDDWQPDIVDREEFNDLWGDTPMLNYMFNHTLDFKLPPKEYKRILVERTMYIGIHRFLVTDVSQAHFESIDIKISDIKRYGLYEAPFRSYLANQEDNVLLDALMFFIEDSGWLCNRYSTSIIERQPANYRCNTFFKIPFPNEDEIVLEDTRFDYFDYWRNL